MIWSLLTLNFGIICTHSSILLRIHPLIDSCIYSLDNVEPQFFLLSQSPLASARLQLTKKIHRIFRGRILRFFAAKDSRFLLVLRLPRRQNANAGRARQRARKGLFRDAQRAEGEAAFDGDGNLASGTVWLALCRLLENKERLRKNNCNFGSDSLFYS